MTLLPPSEVKHLAVHLDSALCLYGADNGGESREAAKMGEILHLEVKSQDLPSMAAAE